MRREGTNDVTLVELAFVMIDNIGARRQVRRDKDVGPVIRPLRIVFIVVG